MLQSTSVSRVVRTEAAAALRSVRRAGSAPGRERDLAVQSGKAALAAVIAWVLSSWLQPDSLALMAPWVAVVLVQATVYRSMARGVQQLLAIALGTVLGTAGLSLLGNPVAAMAVVLPVTILAGNWRRFGEQGIYSATSALFTLTAGEATVADAGERLLAALLGAAVAVGVNALLRPPAYLRDSRKGVQGVIEEASGVLGQVADELDEPWEYDHVLGWYDRARRLPRLIREVRTSVEWNRESMWLNPERRRRAEISRVTPSYDETLHTLDHVADHLSNITRTLLEAFDGDTGSPRPGSEVTGPYALFLRRVANALEAYGRFVTNPMADDRREELREAASSVRGMQDELRAELPRWATGSPEAVAVFGSLLMEARLLTDRLDTQQVGRDEAGS